MRKVFTHTSPGIAWLQCTHDHTGAQRFIPLEISENQTGQGVSDMPFDLEQASLNSARRVAHKKGFVEGFVTGVIVSILAVFFAFGTILAMGVI